MSYNLKETVRGLSNEFGKIPEKETAKSMNLKIKKKRLKRGRMRRIKRKEAKKESKN